MILLNWPIDFYTYGDMVKYVNTLVSKTSAARLPGSIPGIPTKLTK